VFDEIDRAAPVVSAGYEDPESGGRADQAPGPEKQGAVLLPNEAPLQSLVPVAVSGEEAPSDQVLDLRGVIFRGPRIALVRELEHAPSLARAKDGRVLEAQVKAGRVPIQERFATLRRPQGYGAVEGCGALFDGKTVHDPDDVHANCRSFRLRATAGVGHVLIFLPNRDGRLTAGRPSVELLGFA